MANGVSTNSKPCLDVRFFASLYLPGFGTGDSSGRGNHPGSGGAIGGSMRVLSGASRSTFAMLALGSVIVAGCSKVGELKAMKAFKSANQAYSSQDYKKAAELYEEAIQSAPDTQAAH